MKKQAKQAPKKTAITQAVAASNKAKKETQKRRQAALKGHETRRAKDIIEQQAHFHIRTNNFAERTIKSEALLYSDAKTPPIDLKPVGKITGLASANETLSLKLGANIGSLLRRMQLKFLGSETPSTKVGKEETYSPSEIIGSLERTGDNLETDLSVLSELDSLLESML